LKRKALTAAAALAAALAMAPNASAHSTVPDSGGTTTLGPAFAGSNGTSNWSGYVDVAHANVKLRYVASSFTVPTVTCTSSDSKASFWVGLDGYGNSRTVEQVGISTDCAPDAFGHNFPVYRDWWEMYPQGTRYVKGVVPGDQITAAVFYDYSTGVYSLTITDKTDTRASFTVQERCPSGSTCQNTTAEAVLEANGGSHLSKFTTVNFTNSAITSRNGTHGTFGNGNLWNLNEPLMTGSNGGPLANVSGLSNNGGNFSISYHQSS